MQRLHGVRGLLVVAGAFLVVQLAVAIKVPLSFDEAVYLSQVDPRAPALFFSAPRARGISAVAAPLVWVTGSVVALRVYLAVVSTVGLVAAYWPWCRVGRIGPWVPLAALMFSGLWVVGFYGPAVMPNLPVAFGAVAAVGWFLRYRNGGGRGALIGTAVALAVVAVMRPGDAFWVGAMLAAASLATRSWALAGATAAGLAGGGAPWLLESYTRYGGLAARLRRSDEIEGGMGWHPDALLMELNALNGPTLCRPCEPGIGNVWLSLWWLALPALVVGGVIAMRETLLPAVCGLAVSVPYLVILGFAAPRFLIPAYALFALPVAAVIAWAVSAPPERWRKLTASAVSVALLLHLTAQHLVLHRRADRTDIHAAAAARLQDLGFRPPCTITGPDAFPVAYHARCKGEQTTGNNRSITEANLLARAEPMATLTRTGRVPTYARTWRLQRLTPGPDGWIAYIRP